jgi:hypothetical protein
MVYGKIRCLSITDNDNCCVRRRRIDAESVPNGSEDLHRDAEIQEDASLESHLGIHEVVVDIDSLEP